MSLKLANLGGNNFTLQINIDDTEQYIEDGIYAGLEACGMTIESYAKLKCPVDTGLLRNSIAHAVSGEVPSIGAGYKGSETRKARSHTSNKKDKSGNNVEKVVNNDGKEVLPGGTYTKKVSKEKDKASVYVGSNVEYAAYVEMGHRQNVGQFVPKIGKKLVAPTVKAQPYLRPAFTEHLTECEDIIKSYLQDAANEFNNE